MLRRFSACELPIICHATLAASVIGKKQAFACSMQQDLHSTISWSDAHTGSVLFKPIVAKVLPSNEPRAILYCPALTAAIEDDMSGAPLPKARKVTACTSPLLLNMILCLQMLA